MYTCELRAWQRQKLMTRNLIVFTSYNYVDFTGHWPSSSTYKMEFEVSATFIKAAANSCIYVMVVLSAYEGYSKDKPKHQLGVIL